MGDFNYEELRTRIGQLRVHTEVNPQPFEPGDWIRWTSDNRIWEGQVVEAKGPSISVQWIGGEQQVFPVIEGYFPPRGTGLEHIAKPRSADKIAKDAQAGKMSIKRAAAMLGVEPKRVRAMLRSGQLRGDLVDGKWAVVNGEDVMARVNHDE